MNICKILSLMTMGAAFALPSHGQLLRLVVRDKALQENAMFINHGKFDQPKFDENGLWTYSDESVTEGTEVNVMLPAVGFVPAYIEPGKTVTIEVTMKKGKPVTKYSGDNVDVAHFLERYWMFSPERRDVDMSAFADMDDDEMREKAEAAAEAAKTDTISFEEAYKRLDTRYTDVMRLAKAVKNSTLSEKYQKDTRLRYLTNRIELTQLRDRVRGIILKNDGYYLKLISEIDPNDEVGADQMFHLPQTFIESKLITSRKDTDQTAYAIDNIAQIRKYITNETVRHKLLSDLGLYVFNASYSGQMFEMDKFWPAFKTAAPQRTLDYFQPIYDSRMATQAGQPCPDVTFSDLQGVNHKLSDYFGKYIYIDIWATWCGPCCAEIPYIEKHVAHYKDNPKIQFISISIDTNHNAWVKKFEKDKPEWLQFICDKDEQKLISQQWGVTGIPRFIIINPDGTINNAEAFRPSAENFRTLIDNIIDK